MRTNNRSVRFWVDLLFTFVRKSCPMKKLLVLASIFFAMHSFSQEYSDDLGICDYYNEFEENSTEVLYGDNVVLRKKPSKDAKALDTLRIGSEVTILKNTRQKITVNGRESNWYKVASKNGTGYIAGGLIALDAKEFNGGTYLVIAAGPKDNQKFRVRYLKDGDFYGKEGDLYTSAFQIHVSDSKGVEGITSILTIELFAEACGVDGGKTYIFNDDERLYYVMHCSEIGDGGVFWFVEELEFPVDREWGDHITYEREYGESIDEDMNCTRAIRHTVVVEWKDGALFPDVSEMDFEEE